MNPSTVEIHEFSTGIRPEKTANNGWVSRGFTGQYMNVTIDAIPPAVERSIANREFAVTEGASRDLPAIIGRVVGSGEDAWSVIAVVTRGQDEKGRSVSVYRYFLCKEPNNLWKILAWWDREKPRFNPFDTKSVGQPNLHTVSAQESKLVEAEPIGLGKPEPLLLLPEEYNLQTVNIWAIKKAKINQNGQLVSWAFNVEALEQPSRFQVIQAASARAFQILARAIANVPQVLAPVADEEALKAAIRSLMNSSQVKLQAVEAIALALENTQITSEYWHTLFDGQGAKTAINQKIYSPQMVRLVTLRAMVIPETLPEFLAWLKVKGSKNCSENQTVSLEFQSDIRDLFPKDKLANGIKFILPQLLEKEITYESVHWLIMVKGSAWFACRQEFTDDVEADLQLIAEHFTSQSQATLSPESFKCGHNIWQKLIDDWKLICSKSYEYSEYYSPLAKLFEQLEEYSLSAYFYLLIDGKVPKHIFIKISQPSVFGLKLAPQVPASDQSANLDSNSAHFIIILVLILATAVGITAIIKFTRPFKETNQVNHTKTNQNKNSSLIGNNKVNPNQKHSLPNATNTQKTTEVMSQKTRELALSKFDNTSKAIQQLITEVNKQNSGKFISNEIQEALKKVLNNSELDAKIINFQLPEQAAINMKTKWVDAIYAYQKKYKNINDDGIINIPQKGTNKQTTYEQLKKDVNKQLQKEKKL